MNDKQMNNEQILKQIIYNAAGLVPVIAQHYQTGEVLMMAWMNAHAVELTLTTKNVHYWSRSRGGLWRKGETSGHFQTLKSFYVDCDGDTLLIKVDQIGPACHTGEKTCFFKEISL
jgi:phosphoribosyl-AMP cyclohydrolase